MSLIGSGRIVDRQQGWKNTKEEKKRGKKGDERLSRYTIIAPLDLSPLSLFICFPGLTCLPDLARETEREERRGEETEVENGRQAPCTA